MDREQWLKARRLGVSGTDIGTLLGWNPYKTEDDLVLDKLGLGKPFTGNAFTRAGQLLEPYVADLWAARNKTIIINGSFTQSPKNNRHIGTPDFLTGFGNGLEIKTGSEKTYKNGIPKYYEAQCRWYALITERDYWDIYCLIVPKDRSQIPDRDLEEWVQYQPVREERYHRDPDLEAHMIELADRFLAKLDSLRAQEPVIPDWLRP